MKPFKWWEALLVVLLTLLFIPSFFFTTVFSIKPLETDPRFFFVGLAIFVANIAVFFGLFKIISKYYDYHNRKGVKLFFYLIILLPLPATISFLIFYNHYGHLLVYPVLVFMYYWIIEKRFGKFSIKIDKLTDELYVSNLASSNVDIQVVAKNKKVKSSTDEIKVGDIIRITKDGEAILTLDVIKNKK